MLQINAILGCLTLAMLVGAYVTGWGPTNDLGGLGDPWHHRLAIGVLLGQLSQLVLLAAGLIVRRHDRVTPRLYDRLGLTVLCGFVLAVTTSCLGMGVLVGWPSFWHLLLSSAALTFNLGVVAVCCLAVRAETRAAQPRPASNPA